MSLNLMPELVVTDCDRFTSLKYSTSLPVNEVSLRSQNATLKSERGIYE